MKEQKTIDNKKADMNYETIEDSEFYRFENIGDKIEGKLLSKDRSARYNVGMYDIDTKDGTKRILGKTQLDRRMEKISIGDYIKIEYIDDKVTPNGNMMIFEVQRKR